MKGLKKNKVDKAIQFAEYPTYRALHWYRDIHGNVAKKFTLIKPYQTINNHYK
ncbi:hypothetical protein [Aliivibrio fischeri]|uniref:Uncharacterized protein n=1 Tax=Aliivibrio fischeri TaxID=668 RepID=A0A510UNL4_ALIFS|nr:hypothetical protein [Aliivibrio fischeri]MUK51103.1 hypothetical protein [Aliivibrio fischeri]GEK16056.1 hypothetical protein AFI02nite_40920 [Aliivibrio fischeri]